VGGDQSLLAAARARRSFRDCNFSFITSPLAEVLWGRRVACQRSGSPLPLLKWRG